MTLIDRESVNRGLALLDEKRPQWYTEIDVEKLNMVDTDDCILGQLGKAVNRSRHSFSNMVTGLVLVGIEPHYLLSHYGFDVECQVLTQGINYTRGYQDLKEIWIEEINVRLEKASQSGRTTS